MSRAMGRIGRRIHRRGDMNKTESAWANELDAQVNAGDLQGFYYERITLKLADDTRYTPDFMVVLADGTIRFDEVKGFMEEAAFVRLKIASEMYPFTFRLIKKRAKKDGGGWEIKDYPKGSYKDPT